MSSTAGIKQAMSLVLPNFRICFQKYRQKFFSAGAGHKTDLTSLQNFQQIARSQFNFLHWTVNVENFLLIVLPLLLEIIYRFLRRQEKARLMQNQFQDFGYAVCMKLVRRI